MIGGAVTGTLKGYDALMNLVLDDVQETVRGKEDLFFFSYHRVRLKEKRRRKPVANAAHETDEEGNESTRPLGLVVARGTLLVLVSPVDGSEQIANPFVQPDDDE